MKGTDRLKKENEQNILQTIEASLDDLSLYISKTKAAPEVHSSFATSLPHVW